MTEVPMTETKEPETEPHEAAPERARRMLNEKQVLEIVPVSPVTLWRMEKRGQFPRGTFITGKNKIWFEDEIVAWQKAVNGRGRGR
jgi:prophage regulatory protein